MSKTIQIQTTGNTLARGQKSPINVTIQFDKPTKVRGIHAVFHAYEKTSATYTTTSTDGNGNTKTTTHTATEYVDIAKENILLLGDERKGFFSRIGDSMATWVGGGDHQDIEQGEQTFSFDVEIPADALSSFQGKVCEVVYQVTVTVDVPIKFDWSAAQQFQVLPLPVSFQETKPTHQVFPDASGRSFWDKTFGKDVSLNVAVDRDRFMVGDQAMAMLTVESPEPLTVKKIEVVLVGVESATAQSHNDTKTYNQQVCELDAPGVISNESVHEFDITIPTLEGPFTQRGTKFNIEWRLEVRLHVPWAKDPIIRVPIEIFSGG